MIPESATIDWTSILTPIFSAVGVLLAALLVQLARKLAAKWHIDLTTQQEAIIENVAKQATALAEAHAETGAAGATKLTEALSYANTQLANMGIDVEPDKVEATIEKVLADKTPLLFPPGSVPVMVPPPMAARGA